MKHVANRSKSTARTKAKTLTQNKAVAKTKPAAKKPAGKIALNSRPKSSVEKAKSAAVKVAPKHSTRVAEPAIKKAAPKLSAKTLNALKTVSARKAKLIAKPAEKPKPKKAVVKPPSQTSKTRVQKPKTIAPVKKTTIENKIKAERKINKAAVAQKAKLKTAPVKPKTSVKAPTKPIAKTSIKKAKSQSPKVSARPVKAKRQKVEIIVPAKIKSAAKKAKPVAASAKKTKNVRQTKLIVEAKPAKRKTTALIVAAKKVNQKSKQVQPISTAKKQSAKKIVKKAVEVQPIIAKKKVVVKAQKPKLTVSASKVKKQSPKIKKIVAVEKTKPVKNAVKALEPRPQKPKNRKARPISSAVFRGKKERYDFKVFALNEKFEPIPAVYIISKRKTDRNKKGHHALVCIGQTDSIFDELKRHRKGNCVKKHAANAVSILPETDEKTRLKIETDLKAAHSVACNLK